VLRPLTHWLAVGLLLILGCAAGSGPVAWGQEPQEITRKLKSKIAPLYPELARRMNITGTVRLAVVVSPNGTVKSSKPVGGHPLLVSAAMDAIKRWRFEPAQMESSGVVEFKFQPQN